METRIPVPWKRNPKVYKDVSSLYRCSPKSIYKTNNPIFPNFMTNLLDNHLVIKGTEFSTSLVSNSTRKFLIHIFLLPVKCCVCQHQIITCLYIGRSHLNLLQLQSTEQRKTVKSLIHCCHTSLLILLAYILKIFIQVWL